MATIEQQTIFELPMKKVAEVTVILKGSWHQTITRIWGRVKEIDRHLFKVKDDSRDFRWFECSSEMGTDILKLIEEHGKNKKEINLFLNPLRIKDIKPKRDFLNMWQRFKGLFKGK